MEKYSTNHFALRSIRATAAGAGVDLIMNRAFEFWEHKKERDICRFMEERVLLMWQVVKEHNAR